MTKPLNQNLTSGQAQMFAREDARKRAECRERLLIACIHSGNPPSAISNEIERLLDQLDVARERDYERYYAQHTLLKGKDES